MDTVATTLQVADKTPKADLSLASHPQEQSLFFARLTKDARFQLYSLIFGSRLIHVQYVCKPRKSPGMPVPRPWRHCVCVLRNRGAHSHRDDVATHCSGRVTTTLLLTCRRVYSEAARVFYGSNILSFEEPASLMLLGLKLREPQMAMLRQVDVLVSITDDWWRWRDTWALLAELGGLQHARIQASRATKRPLFNRVALAWDAENEEAVRAREFEFWAQPMLGWKGEAGVQVGFLGTLQYELDRLRGRLADAGVMDRVKVFWISKSGQRLNPEQWPWWREGDFRTAI